MKTKNITNLILILFFLILFTIACVDLRDTISGSQTPQQSTPAPVAQTPTPEDETAEMKKKIEELEEKIEEQKAEEKVSTPVVKKQTVPKIRDPKANAQVNSPGDGFLALRSQPGTETGYRIRKIPHGANVKVLSCQEYDVRIGGRNGHWCRAVYGGNTGWVFDGWLVYY